jgi:para-aminobenzoate synthetase/4-amino-4-deoxychorismate lyase
MTSTIQAEVDENLDLVQLFKALFPCGSVTGAPKIRTMEIIQELETEPRGVYTGAIGFLGPDNNAVFNVPIRTVVLNHNTGQMGIGSGIVADSDPDREWQECLLKGKFLTETHTPFELIETILWRPQTGYHLNQEHTQRLKESAAYFNFIFIQEEYLNLLEQTAHQLQETTRVRITLNREGKLTVRTTPCAKPMPFNPVPATDTIKASICLSTQQVSSRNPFLYHKTTRRELYNTTWEKAVQAGFTDAVFTNERDEITEGCISNIFIFKDNILLTPPLSAGLLPGIFRQILLAEYPDQVREQTLYKKDILDREAIICIGNSVRGLVPVNVTDSISEI